MFSRPNPILCVLAPLALALAARVACAGGPIVEAAMRVPASVDALVVLDRACVARQTPAGREIVRIVDALVNRGSVDGAWTELATHLGRTREQAFDELLGRRVALMTRRVEGAAEPTWAVMTVVPLETERRLRERLDVAPRKIVAGHAVMAVEHGRFELTSERTDKWATLLLAPASSPALFDELVPTLVSGPAAPLSADPRFASLSRLGDGELLVWVDEAGPGGKWFGAVARTDAGSLQAGLRMGSRALEGCDANVTPWSPAVFHRLARGALVAMIERPAAPKGRESALGSFLTQLPELALGVEHAPLIGERLALVALDTARGPSVAMALEVRSASLAAGPIDRMFAGALTLAGAPNVVCDGSKPDDARSVRLDDAAALPAWVRGALSGRQVKWRYPLAARAHPAATSTPATVDSIPDDAGWCVAGVGEDAFERAVSTLTGACADRSTDEGDDTDEAEPTAAWVSMGVARPAALVASLERASVALPPELRAFASISRARWAIRMDADNSMTGHATVRFSAAERPTPSGAPPSVASDRPPRTP